MRQLKTGDIVKLNGTFMVAAGLWGRRNKSAKRARELRFEVRSFHGDLITVVRIDNHSFRHDQYHRTFLAHAKAPNWYIPRPTRSVVGTKEKPQ